MQVPIQILAPQFYPDPPRPMTPWSAGFDLRACVEEDTPVWPMECKRIPAGIRVAIPEGFGLLILPRSGLGHKGLVLGNLVGLIDPDYRGEVFMSIWNRSDVVIRVQPGDRIAQGVIVPCYAPEWQVVDSLPDTDRGEGGFGSSGAQ